MSFRDQIHLAWETGEIVPDGEAWDPGEVEPQAPYQNEGSQTPLPHDRDGNEVEVEGVFTPAVERVAARYLACVVGGTKIAGWTPERRLVDALTKGDAFLTHLNYLWREVPHSRKPIEKALNLLEAALQVAGRDIARELGLPSVRYASQRTKTAGEVRFIKDRSGDEKQWGWPPMGPSEREIGPDYEFKPAKLKPLATSLRGTLMALGHAMSAYQTFAKIKSATVSPDGALGGKGYIQKISEIRRQYMNVIEALSSVSDTIYDEINAPHWNPAMEEQSPREREEVRDIMDDVEEIKQDPEEFAKEEEAEMDAVNAKTAARLRLASLHRRQCPEWVNDLDQVRIRRVATRYLAMRGDGA